MALVKKFVKTSLQTERVHGGVDCTYTTFRAQNGRRYFQIDTYGSPNRKLKGKKSQSIQFDEKSARALFKLLESEFSFT